MVSVMFYLVCFVLPCQWICLFCVFAIVYSVAGCALLDRPCMVFQRMCVVCL